MSKNTDMLLYKTNDGKVTIQVKLKNNTVWLTQADMVELFQSSKSNISEHIKHIFEEGELKEESVVRNFRTTASDGKAYNTKYYNLDVIISTGYRIKSLRGTQFRIWATERLKDYLIKGYAINENRLKQKQMEVEYLKTGIRILERAIEEKANNEGIEWLSQFAQGLKLLDDYDHNTLDKKGAVKDNIVYPTYEEYLEFIQSMYSKFKSDVFAKPKDDSFKSSINQIKQCFGGAELYPTLEEKAATLLYLIVKNHSFVDGNKRIAATCFLLFLQKNNALFLNQKPIISNGTLASLTLFIATSKPEEMKIVNQLTISIIKRNRRG